MSIFFKDLAKKAEDLLGKKSYSAGGSQKYSIKSKTADGVSYSAESTVNDGSVKGQVKCAFKHDCGLDFKKLIMATDGSFETDVAVEKIIDDARFTVSNKCFPFASSASCEADVGVEYDVADFKAKILASPFTKKNASASLCFKKDNFFVGGKAGIAFGDEFCVDTYDFGVGFTCSVGGNSDNADTNDNTNDNTNLTFNVSDQLSTFKLTGFTQQCDDVALAGTLCFSRESGDEGENVDDDAAGPLSLEVGGSYNIDNDTTMYGKLTAPSLSLTDLSASFNLRHKLNENATLDVTTVFDLDGSADNFFGSEFGFSLKFGADK